MPMPVSRTVKADRVGRRRSAVAQTRTSPRSVNLSALEMKLRRICETLPSSVSSGGTSRGSSNTSATASPTSSGRSMPRSAPNSDRDGERRRHAPRLAGLDLGEVEQVVDQLGQVLGRLADEADLRLLLRGQLAVAARQQQPRQRQDRVQRRAELVAHVRQEPRLQLVGAAQVVGALVELGVQRDDAAVGVLQLLVEPLPAPPGAPAAPRAAAGSPGSAG